MNNKFIKWLRGSWRPLFAGIMCIGVFLQIIVGWFISVTTGQPVVEVIPTEAWQLMTVFITAYGIGRTVEKFNGKEENKTQGD